MAKIAFISDLRQVILTEYFPHAIEFLNRPYAQIFPILTAYDELANYLSPFMDAWEGGAQDQLQGQIASAKIPLSRMISPALYWVMTGDDFSLDINNPREPKVLVVGNNPDRQNIYSAALGLYNSRIVKLINKKKQLKSSVIIDELPTIYFRGLDNLIATARSNKVAVCLGFQDFSQLTRDYGDKESKVIQNTVGNVFSGQVVGETAKTLSAKRLQSDCKMVVIEAFKTRGNRCRTWSYNDFSLYAVYRLDGLPLGSNSHQSVKFCYRNCYTNSGIAICK